MCEGPLYCLVPVYKNNNILVCQSSVRYLPVHIFIHTYTSYCSVDSELWVLFFSEAHDRWPSVLLGLPSLQPLQVPLTPPQMPLVAGFCLTFLWVTHFLTFQDHTSKASETDTATAVATFPCPICGKVFTNLQGRSGTGSYILQSIPPKADHDCLICSSSCHWLYHRRFKQLGCQRVVSSNMVALWSTPPLFLTLPFHPLSSMPKSPSLEGHTLVQPPGPVSAFSLALNTLEKLSFSPQHRNAKAESVSIFFNKIMTVHVWWCWHPELPGRGRQCMYVCCRWLWIRAGISCATPSQWITRKSLATSQMDFWLVLWSSRYNTSPRTPHDNDQVDGNQNQCPEQEPSAAITYIIYFLFFVCPCLLLLM